jgi:thiosulfate/3-mercaptopyruvate sulfurtransferase
MKALKILLMITLLSGYLLASESLPSIVPVTWLKENIENKHVVLLDLRKYEEYQKNHIEGAVNMPAIKNLFDDKFMMPKLDLLQNLFSNAGIDKNSLVIAYDNGSFIWAARLYWILEILGHKNVGILDVGYGNWKKDELPLSSKDSKIQRKEFIPRVDNTKVQTKLSTLMAINKKTIIDGRKVSHYEGKESTAKRFGHIPTAQNYASTQNYQVTKSGNKMRDLKELKLLYKDLPKDKEIILYCDGGAEAALNYIVLQELGYKASVYDGSWLEWGNDSAVPVENEKLEKKK